MTRIDHVRVSSFDGFNLCFINQINKSICALLDVPGYRVCDLLTMMTSILRLEVESS